MQFKIPQDVQQADKIIGPLTLKQLIICAVGGGISYFIYVSTAQLYVITVWLPFTAIPAIFTLAIAFLKIDGIPFIKYSLLQFERLMLKPQKRHFEKGAANPYISCLSPIPIPKQDKKVLEKQGRKAEEVQAKLKELDRLTKILDTGGEVPKST
ncbi:MAG: hypothetical protein ACD_51C00165G0002 [uncultured bacterium]|nr:MAG: hypothetical protein ACD_51C00165G0002 [uncultured bacterium]